MIFTDGLIRIMARIVVGRLLGGVGHEVAGQEFLDMIDRVVGDLLCQALLDFDGIALGILFCRDEKGVGFDDALTLDGEF